MSLQRKADLTTVPVTRRHGTRGVEGGRGGGVDVRPEAGEESGLKNVRFFKALLERLYFMKSNVCRQALSPPLHSTNPSSSSVSEMVIEINIIPRATFVCKQCPYCNPARSWKWNKAFNELAAPKPLRFASRTRRL